MAPKCYICKRKSTKVTSIFRIPDRHDEYCERGNLWVKILDAEEENINEMRVCSEHFLKGIYDIKPILRSTTLQKKFNDFLMKVKLRFVQIF